MFDTSAQKSEQTVLEKGVRSWVAFGMNIKGQSREMDLATVVKHNIFNTFGFYQSVDIYCSIYNKKKNYNNIRIRTTTI